MKMKKLLASVAAAALAVTTLAGSAFAANIEATKAMDATKTYEMPFTSTFTFAETDFLKSVGAAATADNPYEMQLNAIPLTITDGTDDVVVTLKGDVKIDGSKITAPGAPTTITFGTQASDNKLAAGKRTTFVVTGTLLAPVADQGKKPSADDGLKLDLSKAQFKNNNLTLGLKSLTNANYTTDVLNSTISITEKENQDYANLTGEKVAIDFEKIKDDKPLTLVQKEDMKRATGAKLTLTLEGKSNADSILKLKTTGTTYEDLKVVAKGATSVVFDLPTKALVSEGDAYNNPGDLIKNIKISGDGLIKVLSANIVVAIPDAEITTTAEVTTVVETTVEEIPEESSDVETLPEPDVTDETIPDETVPADTSEEDVIPDETVAPEETTIDENAGGADETTANDGAGDTTKPTDDKNQPTGVALVIVPTVLAAAAAIVARKRK